MPEENRETLESQDRKGGKEMEGNRIHQVVVAEGNKWSRKGKMKTKRQGSWLEG